MKIKRVKQAKRIVSFYHQNFGLRQPYQVLIDGSFAHAALKMKINIREQLPKYLGGEVQCVTSRCACLEVKKLGAAGYGAMQILKQYSERHCGHPVAKAAATPDCITSLIGEENRHNYIVATQDNDLRKRLRQVPGVPILLITHNSIVLEKPSESSMQRSKRLVESKLGGSVAEKESLRRQRPDEAEATEQPAPTRKRKKGANPLSQLKRKKTSTATAAPAEGASEAEPKKKRKRVRPGHRKLLEDVTASLAAESAAAPATTPAPAAAPATIAAAAAAAPATIAAAAAAISS